MSQADEPYTSNLLLGAMSDADLELLKPHLTRLKIEREQVLVTPGEPIEDIYFLEGGVASVTSDMSETGSTEIGLFGREGMSGVNAILGVDITTARTFIQVDGSTALKIKLAALRAAAHASPALQALLLRYTHTILTQVAHCAVCNAHYHLEARLARWLLMCHDRIDGDELFLTHEFMSMMIGAQRTGVTVTLHILEGEARSAPSEGRVIILDRERLEELAGDAYGVPEAEYRQLIGPFGKKAEAA